MIKLRKNKNYNTRKIHRYLGVFIGIQFFLWTVGGLYFSWNNMDDVHGKTLIKKQKKYVNTINFSIVQKGIDSLKEKILIDSIHSMHIVNVFDKPLVQFKYFNNNQLKTQLINAENGVLRGAFSEKECLQLVKQVLISEIPIKATKYYNNTTNLHHEYRGKPLPAYAFTLDHPSKTTVYVSTELGQITAVRNTNWRNFDFLWMLHTMDYQSRDHITNWVLRIFSVLGMITICSGFYLFYLTSPTIRNLRNRFKHK